MKKIAFALVFFVLGMGTMLTLPLLFAHNEDVLQSEINKLNEKVEALHKAQQTEIDTLQKRVGKLEKDLSYLFEVVIGVDQSQYNIEQPSKQR